MTKRKIIEEQPEIDMKLLRDRDKGKLPLKIDRSLTILVNPERCNEVYAEEYRQRMRNNLSI